MALDRFHPAVRNWFTRHFAAPTEPQRDAWPSIAGGNHTLIAAPTGSGKTLAAFLSALNDLVERGVAGELRDETYVVYVSPLKALSNDIQRNLQQPLEGIQQELQVLGLPQFQIRPWVRTGDTSAKDRASMRRQPPHIVVTTPESLYILLSSEGGRSMLRTTRTLIVDEIHAMVDDKRGSHLALSMERLEALVGGRAQRIGLSATQRPIEEVARFLVGSRGIRGDGTPECRIVDSGHRRLLDLAIELPQSPLEPVMSLEVWDEIYDRLKDLILEHRTTLVFVNTRRTAERVCRHLGDRLGDSLVSTHHGSLAREQRLAAEQQLKEGKLRAVVATASLELGIDIGDVDLVCQLGSTRSISTFLQRVGRSGHSVTGTPKGRLFPLTRDELVESAALLASIGQGELDHLEIPRQPLDILAQQIVATVACEEWSEEALYSLVRQAYPYRDLSRPDFDSIIRMLSEGFSTRMGRRAAYLHHDAINHRLRARRGARLAAITSGGAIPDTADYEVMLEPAGTKVGTVNEDFAIESMAGDIFQLGNTSWKILRVEPGRVRVEDAKGQPPSIPFWLGEAPGRTPELSAAVSRLRKEIDAILSQGEAANELSGGSRPGKGASLLGPPWAREDYRGVPPGSPESAESASPANSNLATAAAIAWLTEQARISLPAAQQIVEYLATVRKGLGVIPTQDTLVLERFFDESGGMQLVIHSVCGSRLNRAWGLALRKRFCRKFNFELQAAATEDAIVLSLGHTHSFPLAEVFDYLRPHSVRDLLIQAVLDAPMFTVRWRWNASRALAVLRWRSGRKVAPQLQRMNAEDLLATVFPDQLACAENLSGEREIPHHPLVQQTLRDCLEDAMDIDGLESLLTAIERGQKTLVARDVVEPSPLAAEILAARPYAFLDDAPLEERRTQAVYSRRWLDPEKASDLGQLDAAAIARVCDEARPQVENADELHDALLQLGFLTETEGQAGPGQGSGGKVDVAPEEDPAELQGWTAFFDQLTVENRAARLLVPGSAGSCMQALWVAAERLPEFESIFPDVTVEPGVLVPRSSPAPSADEALVEILRGRLDGIGPVTAFQLAASMTLPVSTVEAALLRLEAEGFVLRGRFTPGLEDTEWCVRRLLARIHRYTLDRLRQEIEPVSASDFIRFLLDWQHLTPDHRADGPSGLAASLEQLEGFEAPAVAWEGELLPARLVEYDPTWLDALCLSGRWSWARLTPPRPGPQNGHSSRPIRSTPIGLLQRRNLPIWNQLWPQTEAGQVRGSSAALAVYKALNERGASFFADLVEQSGLLRSQVEEGLAELAASGLVTADSFIGLRALLTPSSKRPPLTVGKRRRSVAPFGIEDAGRWTKLIREGDALDRRPPNELKLDRPALETLAWILLRRYGVVFRRLLEKEELPPWRDLLRVYRRLEARGEIRGGRFVAGFSGEQFALPEAVGLLRSTRRKPATGALVSVSAADPLNLIGIVTPGSRIPPSPANRLLYCDGVPIAIREAGQIRFLEEMIASKQWEIRNVLIRRSVPPQLRAYLGQPA
ncbi:MAG: DEAD/DEAH box helicase [Acidobacteria bacterium]|nr:DEAD/DEAH box helicase [Acidobacteriota bacterium]MCI0724998.1 DEAD/DEAH box helicase [Acidobacteriota bacterium]